MRWAPFLAVLVLAACCESDRQRNDFRLMSGFEFESRVDEPNLQDDPLVSLATGTEYGVDLRFENRTKSEIWIDWPEARYIDELGRPHTVVAYEAGGLPRANETQKHRTRMDSGSSRFYSVAPKEKVRFERINCFRSTTIYYPIVPWEDADMDTGRRVVTELANRRKEVAFVFPVIINSRNEEVVIFLRPVLLPPGARTQTAE